MKMKKYPYPFAFSALLAVLGILAALTVSRASAASSFYVATSGSDANNCLSPTTPCATINGALAKAAPGDTVQVTAETYYGYGEDFVFVTKDILLSGGWNHEFTSRSGYTILDGDFKRVVIEITQTSNVSLEYFILQNGSSNVAASGISNYGMLTIDHCVVQDNIGTAYGGGITNYGTLTVLWSTVSQNIGPGIYNWDNAGPLTVTNSTIRENSNGVGVHVYNQSASVVNSTISGNINNGAFDGGGIYFAGTDDHSLILRNVTISGNQAPSSGGGIYFARSDDSEVLLSNTIIDANKATAGPDCFGPITSQGYNLLGDSTGCTMDPTDGDQLDVNPMIAPLKYNGGPTQTQRLFAGSPAIDGGNPAGCLDQVNNPLTIDQRGFPRPLDGNGDGTAICDIGAYEYDPNIVIFGSYLPLLYK